MRYCFILICFCTLSISSFAQSSYKEKVEKYVARYKDLAIAEQQRTGVPASVKLAQGIFESAAGESELCTQANNHFGIKCKSNWGGATYSYTDDAPNECFRSYADEVQSYKDHSDFLKNNKRYHSLFQLSVTDYAAWSKGLKSCGYATDPNYAKRLINTIETYRLQEYTYQALEEKTQHGVLLASANAKSVPEEKPLAAVQKQDKVDHKKEQPTELTVAESTQPVADYYQLTTKNGKKGFYAKKGDLLLEFAIKNRVRYAKLLELNDLPDAPLESDMFIYLERKGQSGQSEKHQVRNGESLLQISQHEGIEIDQLRSLNELAENEEPAVGTVLELRFDSAKEEVSQTKPVTKDGQQVQETLISNEASSAYPGRRAEPKTTKTKAKESAPTADGIQANRGYVATPVDNGVLVNIAEEPAIEEQMAEERAVANEPVDLSKEDGVEEVVENHSASEPKKTAPQSPLDKLKAYMDQTVYANKESYTPKSSSVVSENQTMTTRPARSYSSEEPASPTTTTRYHTVRRGDTAFSISKRYGITLNQLKKWNKMSSSTVQLGARLRVVAP